MGSEKQTGYGAIIAKLGHLFRAAVSSFGPRPLESGPESFNNTQY